MCIFFIIVVCVNRIVNCVVVSLFALLRTFSLSILEILLQLLCANKISVCIYFILIILIYFWNVFLYSVDSHIACFNVNLHIVGRLCVGALSIEIILCFYDLVLVGMIDDVQLFIKYNFLLFSCNLHLQNSYVRKFSPSFRLSFSLPFVFRQNF